MENLPEVVSSVDGSVVESNAIEILEKIKGKAAEEKVRILVTDDDFDDKDKFNKAVKEARANQKVLVEGIQMQFKSLDSFLSLTNQIDSVLQKMQSHGEGQVRTAKEDRKAALVKEAFGRFIVATEFQQKRVPSINLEMLFGRQHNPDMETATKNKRTTESMTKALDEEVVRVVATLTLATDTVEMNCAYIDSQSDEHQFLFRDRNAIIGKDGDTFKLVVDSTISEYEANKKLQVAKEKQREKEIAEVVAEEPEVLEPTPEAKPSPILARGVSIPEPETKSMPQPLIKELIEWSQKYEVAANAIDELGLILSAHCEF